MYVRMLGPTGPHRTVIDKILRGTKTAEIPVEQPTKFELERDEFRLRRIQRFRNSWRIPLV